MDSKPNSTPNLEMLLDVRVKLTIELGSCQMPLREALQLAPGSVVKLDQSSQVPVTLYANQKQIGNGPVQNGQVVADRKLDQRVWAPLRCDPFKKIGFAGHVR